MGEPKKLPSGNWRIRVCVGKDKDGKYKYKSFTDPDKRRCQRLASEYADEHRSYTESSSIDNAMERYIQSRANLLSPSTIAGYKNIHRQLKKQYKAFCMLDIQKINQETLQNLINEMTMFVTPKTVRNRYALISAAIRYAGYMSPVVQLPDKVKPDLNIPDVDDVKRLLAESKNTEMEIPIMLGAFAPMRRSEIIALRIGDISGNTIHVKTAVVEDSEGNLVTKPPKTYNSDRLISMPDFVIDKIMEKGYITKIDHPHKISDRFRKIAYRCGLQGTRFHDLRHFCASWLHAQGIPEEYILERGGWNTDGVMKEVYRHALASERNKINKQIDEKMEQFII